MIELQECNEIDMLLPVPILDRYPGAWYYSRFVVLYQVFLPGILTNGSKPNGTFVIWSELPLEGTR